MTGNSQFHILIELKQRNRRAQMATTLTWQRDNLGWYLAEIEAVTPRTMRFNQKFNKQQTLQLWQAFCKRHNLEAAR